MPYKLVIAEELRDVLAESLPSEVLDDLSEALDERLADSPTKWSKPSDFPFAAAHQIFECAVHCEGRRLLFRVSFRYGQDEESLHIASILWTELPQPDS